MGTKFENRLTQALNEELGLAAPPSESVEEMANDLLDIASTLQSTISRCEQEMQDANLQLENVIEQLNTKLGWEIRRRQPKMAISHKGNCCSAGYFSQNLAMKPDLKNKSWQVDGPLSKKFKREYPDAMALSSNPSEMADAVVKFFSNRFRTLS